MLLEILLYLLLGTGAGIAFGLLPGIHPNMILLAVPALLALNLDPTLSIAFLVALGVANAFSSFIPSILLGAPDSESGLSSLPGHRMLQRGEGYTAVKLSLLGGFCAVAFMIALILPAYFAFPLIYETARPYIGFILIVFSLVLIVTEKIPRKIFWGTAIFLLSAAIGLLSSGLPIDPSLVLFPIFAGFFGLPLLILQLKYREESLPAQNMFIPKAKVPRKSFLRASLLGTIGGMFSGLLPGVGSAEIASLATIEKNDKSFLSTMGALTLANIVMSFLALWLIGNPRSGVAVALDQLVVVDFFLFLMILAVVLVSAAISVPSSLFLAKKFLVAIQKANKRNISVIVITFLVAMTALFTGALGLLVLFISAALGIFTNLIGVKRGLLMGSLIVPTMLFFFGF